MSRKSLDLTLEILKSLDRAHSREDILRAIMPRLNALGITAATRAAALPDVPTLKESGVPGSELKQSYGVLLPARATRAIVDRLKAGMDLTQDLPDVKERLRVMEFQVETVSPEEADRMMGRVLNEREKRVLEMRFGLGDRQVLSLEQIGRELELTRERVRQIEAQALRKLRDPEVSARLRECLVI